jgi:hypothetical protein
MFQNITTILISPVWVMTAGGVMGTLAANFGDLWPVPLPRTRAGFSKTIRRKTDEYDN